MKEADQASLFFEVADIISLVEHRYPPPAAKRLRRATRLLVEVGSLISQLPDDSDQPLPPEDQEAFIQRRERIDNGTTPLQDVAWALDKFQARYPRTISKKLGRASKLLMEVLDLEPDRRTTSP